MYTGRDECEANLRKLKALARALDATILRPYYPVSDLYRVVRDTDGLQLDFMATIHGVRSFEGLRARALAVDIDGVSMLVASLEDIIRSKKAARPLKKQPGRRQKLAAVARENERGLRELIRRWQALPPNRRTHFLRKRVGFRMTAL